MFEVSVRFHDDNAPSVKRIDGYSALTLYLERIPNMLGFLANENVTIDIKTIASDQATLFSIQDSVIS